MQKRMKRVWISWLCLTLFLLMGLGLQASAAGMPARITECRLNSTDKVDIKAEITDLNAVYGDRVYLFVKELADTDLKASDQPVAVAAKQRTLSWRVDLNFDNTASVLYSRFVIAQRNANGAYEAIANERYISNPDQLAKNRYKFPTAVSKKGLQVSGGMNEDMAELNVNHSVINLVLSDLIPTKSQMNKNYAIPYSYHGKTYWLLKSVVGGYDAQMKAFARTNMIVSAVLLMRYRTDFPELVYPSGRKSGKLFYAWNVSSSGAREYLQAILSFLAERYSGASGSKGRIVNWIVGNEVNNRNYNYAGVSNLNQYCKIYADSFRLTYNTVKSIYSEARVYISLDHIWNRDDVTGTFAGRKVLDKFAEILKNQGNIQWNLAYHPYGSPLTEPRFWANTNGQVKQALTSPVINMANLGILTSYIKNTYGSSTRIILSEQGYTSTQNTSSGKKNVEKEQAAAIAYSYLLTENDDMVDSFIMNRQVDHSYEVDQGLSLGLWTTAKGKMEWAGKQKLAWSVFKYMDTNLSESVTTGLLSVLGVKNWSELIKNYGSSLYNKISVTKGNIATVKKYKKKAAIPSGWIPYGAFSQTQYKKGTFRLTHEASRNKNALWGYEQEFGQALNFSKYKTFYTTLKVKNASNKKALLKICFYSGKKMLECQNVIKAGKTLRVGVSLAKWKYRDSVTKISVLLAPYGSGKWKSGASLEMTSPVQGS